MKTILLIGKNGQIGWELLRTLAPLGTIVACDREKCDLANPDAVVGCIREIMPGMIVNAAAYTSVDKAESEPELASAINTMAPRILAEESNRLQIPLIHYSTDYIFDGTSSTPYIESDHPNPLNVYGKTKWAGEQAIMSVAHQYIILRTSWVYGKTGKNFLNTMLKLASRQNELRIVNDQFGTPNWSRLIAEATACLLAKLEPGMNEIYHLSCHGVASWYEFAKAIFKQISLQEPLQVVPIETQEYPTPAKRPAFSALNSDKLERDFGIRLSGWEYALKLLIETPSQQNFR